MPDAKNAAAARRRRLTPSRAVTVGATAGTPAAIVTAYALQALGLAVPVEVQVAGAALLSQLVTYFARGGRAGEAD